MPVSKSTLSEQDRARLDTIVSQMQTNGETEESIRLVVDDFKTKYSKKKDSGEESGNGTQNIAQSLSPSTSGPTAAQILNPLFGIQERQMQQSTLLPKPVTPIGKTESQIQQEESQNAFYDKILPTDRLGKKLIQMPNGASISIDPRTIPFSPSIIDNDPDVYISKVRDKINKGEILTPVEQSFISKNQRPISKFTIEDDEQLDILKNANGVNIEAIQDIQIPSQLTNLIPSLAGKTFGEVASTPEGKYVQTQELKRRITRELQSEENKTTGGTGDIKDTQKIAALKEQLDDVSNLETKLSRSLTKISEQEVEGVVRTDESGSNWERFKNSVGGVVNPSWVAPPEVIDRFEKLPKEFVTGLNYLKFKEPVVYKRVSNYLVTGQPISESQIAEITHYGLDIEKEKLQDKFVNQEIDQDQYRIGENDISLRAYNNLVGNKEALRGFLSSNIAELADADNVIGARMEEAGNSAVYGVNKIFGHRWNYTDEEILNYGTQVARANGIDVNDSRVQDAIKYLQDNEGAMIMQNSVAKAGWTRDLAKGLAQPIRGIASSISDIPKTDAEVYAESQSQGNVNVSEQKLKRVENSWEGTVSDVLEGTGQFITQAGLAYATGGGLSALGRGILGRAGVAAIEGEIAAADMGVSDLIGSSLIKSKDAISTFVTSYAQSYDNNLKTALSYTDNDATATIVANSMSFLEGATENFLSPIQVARGIGSRLFNKQTTSKGLVDILSDAEIVDKKSAVADFLKKSLTAGLETAKVAGTEIGEELVTGLADYTANAILNPNSQTFQDRDLLNEVANTAYQTGLSMAIPALVSGASSYNANNFAKGSLLIAAQNRQALLDDMHVRLSDGSMSQDQYNEKAQIINTAATANAELPSKENGSKLNSDEKADYVFSRVSEAILSKRLAATEDQAEKNILEGKIKQQQNLRTKILKNEGNQIPENKNAEVATTQIESAVTAETENTEVATPATNLADEQTVKLLNENAANINIPTYRNLAANADAKMATDILKEVADQWYDPRSREAAERNFTKSVTDAAIRLFPNQEQDDEISFERVVAIEPLLTRVDANEAINDTELNDAENILYEELDRNPNAAPLIEPYILKLQNHENRTTTETVTVAEEIPVANANGIAQRQQVRPALEQSTGTTASITRTDGTTVNGQLSVVDGNYVIQSEEGDIIVGEKAITDRDLSLPEEGVMDNPVEFDNDGNVSAVTFQSPAGDLVKITDPEKALDLAIQLKAQEIGEVPDAMFNQAYETVQKEIQVEVPIQRNGQPAAESTVNTESTGTSTDAVQSNEAVSEESRNEGTVSENTTATGQGNAIPPTTVPSVTENEGEGIAMTHAATAETLNEFALPEYQKEAQTFAQWDEEATQNIKDGKMPALLDKLRNNGEATPVEVRMLGMYIANLKTIASQTKSDADIQKMYEAIKLSDALGSKEGKALTARRGLFMNGDTLADYFQEEMDATAVDTLTPEQKTTAEKEHTDISEAQAAWDIERERLNKQILELQAQAALKKEAAAAAKIKIKKTHEDFVKERQKITDDIREKLRKARSGTNVTIVPYANELFAIAPDVAKLVKSLAQEGIITLTDMVSALKDTLGDAIPQATDSDYRDLIAGAYNEKGKTKNQLAKDLFDLREEARLINKLAALEAGEEPDAPKAKVKRNQQITELRKKIEQFRRDNPTDKDKLAAVKKSYETRIAKIEEDLRTGNFLNNPEPPPTVKLDAEALAAKDKLIKLKNERKLRLLRAEYESRSDVKKGLDVAANILNVPRALMTTLDFSAVLRQGLIPTLSNPTMAIKSAGQMFKSAWTQEAYDRWFYDLENSDSYDTMIDSGLALTDNNNPTLTVKEEAFMSNIVEKIPLVGETLNVKGVKVPGANLIKKSQRAYTAYINKMRVDLFNKFSSAMEEKGMTFENSPEQYKQMAEYINNATGRGSLGKALNKVSPLLNGIFFSPRLIASRLNMLTYLAQPRFYKTVPKVVRDAYFKDMATFAALGNTVLALAYFAGQSGDGEDKDKVTVGYDPRSSDFGKIKSGNTRWDIWGGFQPFMRVAGQILSGQRKSTKTGKVTELNGEGPFSSSRSDVLLSFARGKLAPVPAMSVDLFSKRTAAGEKIIFELNPAERNKQISIGQYAKEHLLPLTYTGVEESMKEDGVRALLTVAVPSIFGIGVQTFGSDEIKIIDDLPKVGPKQLERLEEKGIKTLEDLKKYKGRLGTLRYENEDGEKKKIFNKPQIKSIDSIFNLKPKK